MIIALLDLLVKANSYYRTCKNERASYIISTPEREVTKMRVKLINKELERRQKQEKQSQHSTTHEQEQVVGQVQKGPEFS